MPVISAEELKKKELSQEERDRLSDLAHGMESISKDDTSLLKEDSKLDKFVNAIKVLVYPFSTLEQLQNVLNDLVELPKFLKEGTEFHTNYNILKHDGQKNERLTDQTLDDGLKTLQDVTGIEVDKNAINDAQYEKTIHAGDLGIDPDSKISRPVVNSEVISLEGIQEVGKIGKNFMDPTSSEYKAVDDMLKTMGDMSDSLQKTIEFDFEFKDKKGFEYEETVKLKDKIDEFRNAVVTIRKAGTNEADISSEEAGKALDTVKNMPAFLMDGFGTTFYERLKNKNLNEAAFENGMNALEKSLKLGIKVNDIITAVPKENMSFKANESIEDEQKIIRKNKQEYLNNSDLLKQTITKIMATRMAVNSILGNGKSLDVPSDSIERFKAEQKLLGNQHFRDFLSTVAADPKKAKVAISAATAGHGGGLDKMFTAYLKTRPAGELKNDPEIERFMPTVKSRIEFLQTQSAEHYRKDQTAPVAEIAEIMTLREVSNLRGVNKPALNAKIPTHISISNRVNERVKDAAFNTRCNSRAVLDFICKGHGGEMDKNMKNMEKVAKESAQPAANKPEAPKKGGPGL